jgi:hypothetical protein
MNLPISAVPEFILEIDFIVLLASPVVVWLEGFFVGFFGPLISTELHRLPLLQKHTVAGT